MQQVLDFTNPLPEGVTGLRLFFVVSRTSIFASRVSGLPAATSVSVRVEENGVDVHWTPELPPGSEILVSLDMEGEPLVVSKTLWFQGERPMVEWPLATGDTRAVATELIADPNAYARAKFRERCAAVQNDPDPLVRKYGAFFCELDVNTNIKLMADAGLSTQERAMRVAMMERAEPEVGTRILRRRGNDPDKKCRPPMALPSISFADEISMIMLKIYRRHLSTDGVLNVDEVWTAFEMFANGELRVPGATNDDWNSEPNGAMAFGFAEFAFEAVDQGIDAAEWRAILPSHVAMQEIFITSYGPPEGVPLFFNSYSPKNWSKAKVNADMKKKLRARYSVMSLADLKLAAASHVCRGLKDHP
jgi:hypothetical protein